MIQGYLPEPWILHYCPGGNLIQKNKKKELSPEEKMVRQLNILVDIRTQIENCIKRLLTHCHLVNAEIH